MKKFLYLFSCSLLSLNLHESFASDPQNEDEDVREAIARSMITLKEDEQSRLAYEAYTYEEEEELYELSRHQQSQSRDDKEKGKGKEREDNDDYVDDEVRLHRHRSQPTGERKGKERVNDGNYDQIEGMFDDSAEVEKILARYTKKETPTLRTSLNMTDVLKDVDAYFKRANIKPLRTPVNMTDVLKDVDAYLEKYNLVPTQPQYVVREKQKTQYTPKPTPVHTPKPLLRYMPQPTPVHTPKPTLGSTSKPTLGSTSKPTLGSTSKPSPVHAPVNMSKPAPLRMPNPTLGYMPQPTPINTTVHAPKPTPVPIKKEDEFVITEELELQAGIPINHVRIAYDKLVCEATEGLKTTNPDVFPDLEGVMTLEGYIQYYDFRPAPEHQAAAPRIVEALKKERNDTLHKMRIFEPSAETIIDAIAKDLKISQANAKKLYNKVMMID